MPKPRINDENDQIAKNFGDLVEHTMKLEACKIRATSILRFTNNC